MTTAVTECARCFAPIVDPTTQVVHGNLTYCCTNCSEAMEQHGAGSDPNEPDKPNDLKCYRCGSPIVEEMTIAWNGDQLFCCPNCKSAQARPGPHARP